MRLQNPLSYALLVPLTLAAASCRVAVDNGDETKNVSASVDAPPEADPEISEEEAGEVLDSMDEMVESAQPVSHDPTMQKSVRRDEYNELSQTEERILLHKGTERAGTGELLDNKAAGTYVCRQCNAALYRSTDKFESHCGWPSFDDEIEGAVRHQKETDGTYRVEIVCENCDGHLGHVFHGERFTEKNTRHCVNSVSMAFVPEGEPLPERITIED